MGGGSIMYQPVYRVVGWKRRKDISLESCCFSIELDARFAEKAIKMSFEHQRRFEELIRERVGYKYARATFLDGTAFLQSMAVEGDCACLSMQGNLLEADWSDKDTISYNGH